MLSALRFPSPSPSLSPSPSPLLPLLASSLFYINCVRQPYSKVSHLLDCYYNSLFLGSVPRIYKSSLKVALILS
ncbi:hypothetical protein P153DRAFT_137688 [Dothidotthia symphoricarpi CBS 119687]|uniref:Uncharacterized protein n=1 Tax=Dothidotthia symphoricarpi CBS 119687 TaxID=1392245 RepID=A0A6A5ZWU9_9PLEO|nr:uncharacterized protein P153DRAFT_137688 [Dothidotthia symphoricarpi CBS 119687]KAF2124232.1 hypothetical protein P153DRAFT_137688 [Dothidotthia symphoricarpi CBS 119687]